VTDRPSPIRVATWNLWWRFGPWEQRRDAITAVLADARPDVCGLQEGWAGRGEHLAAQLAERLGMHWAWTASPAPERWQERIGDPAMEIGNAILSRWPITEQASQRLPAGDGADDGRTVLFARVQTPTGPLPFITTQLTSTIGQSLVRCQQVAALCRFVAVHAGQGFPPVVTGDLNAEPDADEIRLLGGHKTAPVVPGLVLVDAWRYADPMSPGWTWDRRNPYVAATGEPSARIDYVLVGLPAASGAGRVQSVRLIGDQPVDGVWPSDHAGVLAELQPAAPAGRSTADLDGVGLSGPALPRRPAKPPNAQGAPAAGDPAPGRGARAASGRRQQGPRTGRRR
jgi:endonuclease/exonuclease/phosphatase family metal-dependent hydrolase